MDLFLCGVGPPGGPNILPLHVEALLVYEAEGSPKRLPPPPPRPPPPLIPMGGGILQPLTEYPILNYGSSVTFVTIPQCVICDTPQGDICDCPFNGSNSLSHITLLTTKGY